MCLFVYLYGTVREEIHGKRREVQAVDAWFHCRKTVRNVLYLAVTFLCEFTATLCQLHISNSWQW